MMSRFAFRPFPPPFIQASLFLNGALLAALAAASLPARPAVVSWSGTAGFEGFYQDRYQDRRQDKAQRAFIRGQVVLSPSLSVLDGLTLQSRLEFALPESVADRLRPSAPEAQRSLGWPLLYISRGKAQGGASFSPLLFEAKRIYINYETEFFILQAGRSGRHFGLGATYNDSPDAPFALKHWQTTADQLFFYTEYGPFHIEPALLIYEGEELAALLQGGIQMESWKAEGFYRYSASESSSFAEVFGEYKQALFKAALSLSYNFERGADGLGIAFEAEGDLPWKFAPKAFLKGGLAGKGFAFHPAHSSGSLLFQNYAAPPASKEPAAQEPAAQEPASPSEAAGPQEASAPPPQKQEPFAKWAFKEGRLNDVIYFAPGLKIPLSSKFEFSPLALIAYEPGAEMMSYEVNAKASFFLEERFVLSLALAGAFLREKFDFGLLASSALSF